MSENLKQKLGECRTRGKKLRLLVNKRVKCQVSMHVCFHDKIESESFDHYMIS